MGSPSARLLARSLARLARVRRALIAAPMAAALPQARAVFTALEKTMMECPEDARSHVLLGPDLRGFLSETETWLSVRRQAKALLALERATAIDRSRKQRMRTRLFERISQTRFLVVLTPHGRVDAAFESRCLRVSSQLLRNAVFDLAALTLGLRLIHKHQGTLRLLLQFREDGELGRPADRIDLGTISGPAGPMAIVRVGANRGRRRAVRRPPSARDIVRAALRGTTLALSAPGSSVCVIPAAGTRLLFPEQEREGPRRRRPAGVRFRRRAIGSSGATHGLVRREMIPGTSILLSPVVESLPYALRVGSPDPALGRRLAHALRVVLISWPEAYREIERRTFMVVPIHEPGTVSYSMADRPGVSYIAMSGKSILDLADDLLHETAHHRLHDLQEIAEFLRPGEDTRETQAFYSPWRAELRPLHGLLHGVYTFQFRAELLRRILKTFRRHPRLLSALLGREALAFARRELRRERRMIASALRRLGAAGRSGLLSPAGNRLLREMRAPDGPLSRGSGRRSFDS